MLKFKLRDRVPPGGRFFYIVPETSLLVESLSSLGDLVARVTRHLEANDLKVPENLAAVLEDYICRNVADGFCEGDDEGRPRRSGRNLTAWTVEKKTRLLHAGGRGRYVDKDAAEARAAVCLNCELNLRGWCTGCGSLKSVIRGLTGGRHSRLTDYLGVCGATEVFIEPLVFCAEPELKAVECEFPEKCWIRKRG